MRSLLRDEGRARSLSITELAASIAVRSMVYLSLDGADAARYLSAVKETLERGDFAINETKTS